MAGKFLSVKIHLIWSTKGRRRLLQPQWMHRLFAFIATVARAKGAILIEANSQPDHIHLIVSMPSTISIAELVNAIKANSTRWIRQTLAQHNWFGWQDGYAAFSVSTSLEQTVIQYIRDQDQHHRRRSFQEELLELLDSHGVEYDPRYVFD